MPIQTNFPALYGGLPPVVPLSQLQAMGSQTPMYQGQVAESFAPSTSEKGEEEEEEEEDDDDGGESTLQHMSA